MANIPNFSFASGTVFTPELADLAYETPIFDGQTQYKGHREKIRDDELSDDPGSIKGRVGVVTEGLKPSIGSGLTVNYSSGVLVLPNGTQVTVPAGAIVVADNATSSIWISEAGTVETGLVAPPIRLLIAIVTTVSGSITNLQDQRVNGIHRVFPIVNSVKIFGGTSNIDKVCTNGEVLSQGQYFFRSFTVPAGITVTVDKYAKILCSGNVVIDGVVNVTPAVGGVPNYPLQVFTASDWVSSFPGRGISPGSLYGLLGTPDPDAPLYSYMIAPIGSSGSGGIAVGQVTGVLGGSGAGGGGLWIECAGTISVTGTINARGENAYPSSTSFVGTSGTGITGSGGGSGGLIYLASLRSVTVSPTATLDVRGGNGQNSLRVSPSTVGAFGGGGGGGGWIVAASPNNNLTGATINLAGGTQGTSFLASGGAATFGGGGGGGFGGKGAASIAATGCNGGTGQLSLLTYTPVGF